MLVAFQSEPHTFFQSFGTRPTSRGKLFPIHFCLINPTRRSQLFLAQGLQLCPSAWCLAYHGALQMATLIGGPSKGAGPGRGVTGDLGAKALLL